MAYDPEARESGNTAMIISIVVLVLLAVGALAYYATRPGPAVVAIDSKPDTTIVNPPPAVTAPPVVTTPPVVNVNPNPPIVVTPGTKTEKTTVIDRERSTTKVVPAPGTDTGSAGTTSGGTGGTAAGKDTAATSSSTTNVNINAGGASKGTDTGADTSAGGTAAGGTAGAKAGDTTPPAEKGY
ncbi:MAG: hypothetical protein M3347_02890 [Armatimonadota bacterium]|nr:hypothetical protein [Armatimonadota bacterium]